MISRRNLLLASSSGRLDNIVVKQYGEKTVITKAPDMSRRKLSPIQKEHNERMRIAVIAAKAITANPGLKQRACELLGVTANKLYRALIKHYLLMGDSEDFLAETEQEKRDKQVLKKLVSTILTSVADARIMLFGERARQNNNGGGHWDILVLTDMQLPPSTKWELQEQLLAITMPYGVPVNLILLQNTQWLTDPLYEALRNRIQNELVVVS